MATTVVNAYDVVGMLSQSGSPEWPIYWQPEYVDDVTYHYTTIHLGSALDLINQYYTGDTILGGGGGYFQTRMWFAFQSADLPSNPSSLTFSFKIENLITLRQRDASTLQVWLVPRIWDPPDAYGTVDPNPDAASERDWELSDGSLIGTVSNPYSRPGETITISVPTSAVGSSFFSIVLLLDRDVQPSEDVDGSQHDQVPLDEDSVTITAVSSPTNPVNIPNVSTPQKEIQRLPSVVANPVPPDPQIERRRYAEFDVAFILDAAHWGTVREGDILQLHLPVATNRPMSVRARVLSRSYSHASGVMTCQVQVLHALDRFGDPSIALRLAPLPPVNRRSDPTLAIPAQWEAITQLALK